LDTPFKIEVKPDEPAQPTGSIPDQIPALEEAQGIPVASYVVEEEMAVTSSFGTYHMPITPKRYYHPSIEGWVARALSLAQTCDLRDVTKIVRV
jgi:hypothetical protein